MIADDDEFVTCGAKAKHATLEHAQIEIARMRRRSKCGQGKSKWHSDTRLTTYRCPYCHHWHIGNQTAKRRKK